LFAGDKAVQNRVALRAGREEDEMSKKTQPNIVFFLCDNTDWDFAPEAC
jgi:hypothetical protein